MTDHTFRRRKDAPVVLVAFDNALAQFDDHLITVFANANNRKEVPAHRRKTPVELNFSRKDQKALKELALQESFFATLEAYSGAVLALKEMRAEGMDVRIVYFDMHEDSCDNLKHRIAWLHRVLATHEWGDRLICAKDKTILRGDYLIDPHPSPEATGNFVPEWQHIVFDQVYNRDLPAVAGKKRLSDWSNWKASLEIANTNNIDSSSSILAVVQNAPYYNHGSANSVDIDRFYVLPQMPSLEDCYKLSYGFNEDRNFVVIGNHNAAGSVITDAWKGTPDQCNNGLYTTYSFHKQDFSPCPVTRQIMRILPLKLMEAVRKILARSGRHSNVREKVNQALVSRSFVQRLNVLEELDYCQAVAMSTESKKIVAFQFAQISALIYHGRQIFSKATAIEVFPELEPFMMRNEAVLSEISSMQILNDHKIKLLHSLKGVTVLQLGDMVMFRSEPPASYNGDDSNSNSNNNGSGSGWNHLKHQCWDTNVIVHIIKERCIHFGLTHQGISQQQQEQQPIPLLLAAPDWPTDSDTRTIETALANCNTNSGGSGEGRSVVGVFQSLDTHEICATVDTQVEVAKDSLLYQQLQAQVRVDKLDLQKNYYVFCYTPSVVDNNSDNKNNNISNNNSDNNSTDALSGTNQQGYLKNPSSSNFSLLGTRSRWSLDAVLVKK